MVPLIRYCIVGSAMYLTCILPVLSGYITLQLIVLPSPQTSPAGHFIICPRTTVPSELPSTSSTRTTAATLVVVQPRTFYTHHISSSYARLLFIDRQTHGDEMKGTIDYVILGIHPIHDLPSCARSLVYNLYCPRTIYTSSRVAGLP